jgi:2-polyprenyl-3-methyl-5-hydroxy-6-metoxy-1,4-benzoquinol methylase
LNRLGLDKNSFNKALSERIELLLEIDNHRDTYTEEELQSYPNYLSDLRDHKRRLAACFRHTLRNSRLFKFINENQIDKVLDCGSGIGNESLLFAKRGLNVVACEINRAGISIAEKRYQYHKSKGLSGSISFRNTDVKNILMEDEFDIIFVQEAISHIHPAERFLELTFDAVNPGGLLYINDTNALNPIARLMLFKQYNSFKYSTCDLFDPEKEDYIKQAAERLFSANYLVEYLKKVGFRRVVAYHYGFLPIMRIANAGCGYPLGLIENMFSNIPLLRSLSVTYVIMGYR